MDDRSSQPSAVAMWLLLHLGPRKMRASIAGDLQEQFSEGRSTSWLWKEVGIAILTGLAARLRSNSVQICVWTVVTALYPLAWSMLFRTPQLKQVWTLGIPLLWPLSMFYDIAMHATFATFIALMVFKAFGAPSLRRVAAFWLIFSLSHAAWLIARLEGFGLAWLPFLVALLAALCSRPPIESKMPQR
jgi:hypothetical protein